MCFPSCLPYIVFFREFQHLEVCFTTKIVVFIPDHLCTLARNAIQKWLHQFYKNSSTTDNLSLNRSLDLNLDQISTEQKVALDEFRSSFINLVAFLEKIQEESLHNKLVQKNIIDKIQKINAQYTKRQLEYKFTKPVCPEWSLVLY